MAANNILKFQVAIEDNATKGLDEIEKRLNGIVDRFKSAVGGINGELGSMGRNIQLPNMAEAIKQTEQLKESLKKNTGDIPLFKNVLEQMQQLQNFIGKNTLGGELDRMKKSLNSVFSEIPNVNASSFTSYFNQLSKAYSDFMVKFGTQRSTPAGLASIGESMQRMGGLSGSDSLLRDYQAQSEQIKATIVNTIKETNDVISATKALIAASAKDFGKIDANINKVIDSLTRLSEAFTKFNGTIGGDQNLKNMMVGMGEIIRNVKFSLNQLEKEKNKGVADKSAQDTVKSYYQARLEIERLVQLIEKLKSQRLISKNLGLDTSDIDRSIARITELRKELVGVVSNGGLSNPLMPGLQGVTTSELMMTYKDSIANAKNNLVTQSQANAQALIKESQAQKEEETLRREAAARQERISEIYQRNVQKIEDALIRIQEARMKVSMSMKIASDNGSDTTGMKNYLSILDSLQMRLNKIRNDDNLLKSPSSLVEPLGARFKHLISNSNDFAKQATEIENSANRVKEALGNIETLRSRLTSSIQEGLGKVDNSSLRSLFADISSLQKQIMSAPNQTTAAQYLEKDYDALISKINEAIKLQGIALQNRDRANSLLTPLSQLSVKGENTYWKADALGISGEAVQRLDNAITSVSTLRDKILLLTKEDYSNNSNINSLISEYNSLKITLAGVIGEVDRLNRARSRELEQDGKLQIRMALKEQRDTTNSWKGATESLARYMIRLKDMEAVLSKVQNFNASKNSNVIDTSELERDVNLLRRVVLLLGEIRDSSNGRTKSGLLFSNVLTPAVKSELITADRDSRDVSSSLTQALKNEAQAQKENELAKRQAAQANAQLSQEESRLAQAIQQSTNSMHGQSQVISDLKSMAMQYLSVWGAQQFISDMTNITGELELQKKSLEVILNNASAAQQMYSEIRNLSQESPYTFEDLLKSHRQLAAFGIEAKDIFSTMKSLSDIGAGLDVDISRLILAYGHTRSYGYLSGIQNRQFENAGIDMIGGLADKYNKLAEAEKRAGNYAEFVTRKDIFSRMRDRSIPFEDVQDVVMDLDRPGGKFYNMQERQYETLGGKLRNLRNNYRIMMSEIGGTNKGVLMGSVNLINNLTENWSKYATVLSNILLPLGAMKIAMLAVNSVMGKQAIAAAAAIKSQQRLATMQREVLAMQNNAAYMYGSANGRPTMGSISQQIGYLWGNMKGWSATPQFDNATDFRKAISNSGMSQNNLMRLSLNKNLSREFRMIAGEMAGLNASAQKFNANLTGWSRRLRLFGLNLASVGAFMKGMWVTIFNPMTAVFAALSAVTAIINRVRDVNSQVEELASTIRDVSQTDIKGLQEILDNNGNFIGNTSTSSITRNGQTATGVHIIDLNQAELDGRNLEDIFNELKLKLQQQSPMYDRDIVDIEKAETQADRLKAILQKFEDIKYAKQVEQLDPDSIANAAAHTGNWDTFGEAAKEFQDEMKSFTNEAQKITDTQWNSISKNERDKIMEYGATRDEAIRNYYFQTGVMPRLGNGRMVVMGNMFTDDIREEFKDVQKQSDELVQTFTSALTNSFKDSPDGFSEYFEDMMSKVFTQSKVDDPFAQMQIKNYLMHQIEQSINSLSLSKETKANLMKNITQKYLENQVLAQYMSNLSPQLKENTTDAQADKIAKKAWNETVKWAKSVGVELYNVAKNNGRLQAEGLRQGLKAVRVEEQWKKDYMSYVERNNKLKTLVKNSASPEAFIEEAKKIRDEAKKKLKAMETTLRYTLGLKVGVNIDASELRKQIAVLKGAVQKIKNGGRLGKDGKSHRLGDSYTFGGKTYTMVGTKEERTKVKAYELANSMLPDAEAIEMLDKLGNNEHISWDDSGKKGSGKSGKGSNAYKDEFSSRWDERIRIMKEAYDWYDKWEKKIGNDAAINEVNAKYGDIFKQWKTDKVLPMDFDVKKIKDYQVYVEKIRDDALKRYESQKNDKSKNNGQEVLRVYRQAVSLLQDIRFDNFTKAAEKFQSIIEKTLNDLERSFKVYDNVLKSTGDRTVAAQLAGFGYGMPFDNVADLEKSKLQEKISGYEDALAVPIKFDVKMSDQEIIDNVKQALGGTKYEEEIDGIVSGVKKWRDAQMNAIEEAANGYAQLIGSMVDYNHTLNRNEAEYENILKNNALLKSQGLISSSQEAQANEKARIDRDTKNLKASVEYINMMNNSLSMTREELVSAADAAKHNLNEQLMVGSITANDYANELQKINSIITKWDSNSLFGKNNEFTSFVKGGIPGLSSFYEGRINKRSAELAERGMTGTQISNDEQIQSWTKSKKILDDFTNKMGDISLVLDVATGALDGLSQAATSLSSMFDALGDESKANFWSDVSDTINGISSVLAPANDVMKNAMSGNVSGLVSSIISAPVKMFTSPVTAFSQLHDKKIERQIEKLREDLSRIEGYTQTIAKAQERTLGYDIGSVLQGYKNQYANLVKSGSGGNAAKAMLSYYQSAGPSSLNGYEQQLNLLNQQRQDYVDMYNKEDKKKKKSSEAMEEYKEKIAELDDQIRYFTEDLAKELWGIDVKGWADQLSDALANAFENGENMAKAYGDTVKSILQSVASKMMQMEVLEPMFEKLRTAIFGDGENNKGVWDSSDMVGSAQKVSAIIGDFFGKDGDGQKAILAAQEFMTSYEKGLNDAGLSLKNSSGSTLSSGTQGTSEETSDLIAGYINALRQDVSVIRILKTQFINEAWPDYIKQITGMATTLGRIDANVAAIRSIVDENGALYERVDRLASDLHSVIYGNQRMHIA